MHIFVGNLEFSATEQDIRQPFERYGVVDTVRIMTDRETGRPRGFGFVEMSDDTAARAQPSLDCKAPAFGGRTLTVNEAKPRRRTATTTARALVTAGRRVTAPWAVGCLEADNPGAIQPWLPASRWAMRAIPRPDRRKA